MENRDDESDKKKEIADDVEEQFPYNVYLPERGYLTYPDNSLLCLGVNNRFRFMMIWVNEWPWFDRFVLFLIVLNSLFLAFNDFEFRTPSGETSWRNDLVDDSEIIFQILFTIECVIKITAMGFVTEQGTYIRDPWNVLDFLVVIIGWVGLLPGVANLTALRAIRVLRPLRSVKKIEKMRVLVASLMKSIPALANVVIFLFFILLVFSIIGVYFFRGLNYQRCRYTDEPVSGEDWIADPNIVRLCSLDADFQIFQCPEDRYCGLPGDYFMFDYIYYAESKIEELDYGLTTFDNVASASYSILQIITLEGWTKMMYNYYDCWNPWFVSLYFTIVVIMGAFFLLNLLLAAIYMNFGKVKASILAEKEESQRIEQERQETLGSAHNVVVSAAISQADLENLDDDDTSQQLSKQKTSDKQVKRAKSSKSSKSNSQSSQHSSSSMVIASNENRQGNFGNNEDLVGVGDMSSSAHLEQPDCRPNTMSHMKNSRSLEEQSNGFQISSANDELLDETTEDQSKLVIVYPLGFRNSLQILVENKWFNNFITLCIILNVVFLALDRYPMDKEEQFTVEMANLVFYVIFALEMILKLYALGIRGYSSDRFNVFDGIIVILSTLELVLTYAAAGLGTGGVISAFRALRLLRVFKLAKNWPDFQDLIATMTKTLADISYFGILMFLFIFIFSLLGMEFFAHKVKLDEDNQPDRHGDSPRENFDDFFHAFVTIFVILVGDDWQFVYYHSSRTVGPASLVYFLALAIMGNFILLNLFLAILLGNFEKGQTDEGREAAKEKQEKAKRDAEEEEKYEKELDRIGSQVKRSSTVGLSGKALWIFDRSGFVRKTWEKIIRMKHFDNIILLLIVISSVALAIDNPLNDPEGDMSKNLYILDIVMTTLFVIEMLLKIIAKGFLMNGKNSYLRGGWNILDFFIVCVSLISLGMGDAGLNFLKALRTLRVLRPLRLISRNESMKLAINALISSIPKVGNVLLICFFFLLLFAIVGVNYFKGTFFYCDLEDSPKVVSDLETKQECIDYGGYWLNQDSNFDNVLNGMLTLFISATTEGWVEIMHWGVDSVAIDKQPQPENNFAWCIFFILFILLGSFFILNLLVGVIIEQFNIEKDYISGDGFLKDDQKELVLISSFMVQSKPIKMMEKPDGKIAQFCFAIAQHKKFDSIIMTCIIFNSIVLALKWYGQTAQQIVIIDWVNFMFTVIFLLEAVIKITAYKREYFKESWNRFDFFIVAVSVIDTIVTLFIDFPLLVVLQLFRIFRIGRVVRLIKKAKSLKIIFSTFVMTIPKMANIGSLLLLFIFIYTVLGVQLFAKTKINGALNEHVNFQEFWKAFMLLLRASTGEAWNELMYANAVQADVNFECIEDPTYDQIQDNDGVTNGCGSVAAYIYFISFVLILQLIFLNLFIAVILTGYEDSTQLEDSWLTGADMDNFRESWARYDPKATEWISVFSMMPFLRQLDGQIGWKDDPEKDEQLQDYLVKKDIYSSPTVHFFELASHLAAFKTGADLDPDNQVFKRIQQMISKAFPKLTTEKKQISFFGIILLMRLQKKIRRWLISLKEERGSSNVKRQGSQVSNGSVSSFGIRSGTQNVQIHPIQEEGQDQFAGVMPDSSPSKTHRINVSAATSRVTSRPGTGMGIISHMSNKSDPIYVPSSDLRSEFDESLELDRLNKTATVPDGAFDDKSFIDISDEQKLNTDNQYKDKMKKQNEKSKKRFPYNGISWTFVPDDDFRRSKSQKTLLLPESKSLFKFSETLTLDSKQGPSDKLLKKLEKYNIPRPQTSNIRKSDNINLRQMIEDQGTVLRDQVTKPFRSTIRRQKSVIPKFTAPPRAKSPYNPAWYNPVSQWNQPCSHHNPEKYNMYLAKNFYFNMHNKTSEGKLTKRAQQCKQLLGRSESMYSYKTFLVKEGRQLPSYLK